MRDSASVSRSPLHWRIQTENLKAGYVIRDRSIPLHKERFNRGSLAYTPKRRGNGIVSDALPVCPDAVENEDLRPGVLP